MQSRDDRGGRASARLTREDAERLAIAALGFLAADAERLGRFLAITGLGPENLRQAAGEPHFLGQVLGHVAEDESLLLSLAADLGENPHRIGTAHRLLAGPPHEREDP